MAMFMSHLVCIINTNYSRLSWCCFSSHFVVPRYPCELGCFDDELFVDQPKNRLVANIVVVLFEALYTLQLQWNLDLTKCQGTGEIDSLYGGFVISRFFSIHYTNTG